MTHHRDAMAWHPYGITNLKYEGIMAYIIINTKTLQCLCQTIPVNYRCHDYWADTNFNPWVGRRPMGCVRTFDKIYRASVECAKHTNCVVARYDPCMNQITRL